MIIEIDNQPDWFERKLEEIFELKRTLALYENEERLLRIREEEAFDDDTNLFELDKIIGEIQHVQQQLDDAHELYYIKKIIMTKQLQSAFNEEMEEL